MTNEQRTTNYELRTNKAFTLIELVVAVGILAMVLSFAGVIFKVSINAHRASSANAEIMQKLRAITDQLSADFKGLRADAPLLIWFQQDANDPDQRYDQILVFADGDFQSTQLYDKISGEPDSKTGEKLVRGNVARIQYAQAQIPDPNGSGSKGPFDQDEEDRILARRRHILTADPCLAEWPEASNVSGTFDEDASSGKYKKNELYEHDSLSLSRWKTVVRDDYKDKIIPTCFEVRTKIDMDDPNTFHKLMCSGIGSFTIQWAYWDEDDEKFYWFPSDDPDGTGNYSHFGLMSGYGIVGSYPGFDVFGVFFNIPTDQINYWGPVSDMEYKSDDKFDSNFYPRAIKFTFKLYDSKAVIENGREFTHIVYLRD